MKWISYLLFLLCLNGFPSLVLASVYSHSKFVETKMCGGNAIYEKALSDMRTYIKIDNRKALAKMLRYPFWVIIEDDETGGHPKRVYRNNLQRFYINNPKEFKALYPKFMLPIFKSTILSLSNEQIYARTSAYTPEAHPRVLVLSKDNQLLELYGKSKNSNDKSCEQVEIEFYRMMVNPNKS